MKKVEANDQWKKKYFDSLTELENREKDWSELEALFKVATVRLSLSLDGVDKNIDYKLTELRDSLRKKITFHQLQQCVKTITSILDRMEVLKTQDKSSSDSLHWMLYLIDNISFPKQIGAEVKALKMKLLKRDPASDPQSLSENVKVLFENSFKLLLSQQSQQGKRRGFLSRIKSFDKTKDTVPVKGADDALEIESASDVGSSAGKNPLQAEEGHQSYQAGLDVMSLIVERIKKELIRHGGIDQIRAEIKNVSSAQQMLIVAEKFTQEINSQWHSLSDTDSDKKQANQVLFELLEKIDMPHELEANVNTLRDQLSSPVASQDWPLVIEKTAALVKYLHVKSVTEKRDLELFLTRITEKLQLLDNSLVVFEKERKQHRQNSLKFSAAIQNEVKDLRLCVNGSMGIDQLKVKVVEKLEGITRHMDELLSFDEKRDEKAKIHIAHLSSKLTEMEKQAGELKAKVIKQRKLATHDRLTGLPNRMAYDERLDQEYRRWKRFCEPLSLALFDVDYFKKVNDQFGHKAGDRVLAVIANVLNKNIRETDFVARYGGEEFAVLMIGAGISDAINVANKLRAAIEDCGFHFRDKHVSITLSAGIAGFNDNDTPENVFERADKALYAAKNLGRNRCEQG